MDSVELAAELVMRMDRDQQARDDVRGDDSADAWERVRAVDAENTAWLVAVLDDRGWPRRSDVGDPGALAAWLLAQHADQDPDFQRRCLTLLKQAVDAGEADAAHVAYLTDRVRRADGQPQRYGTQFWYGPDGEGPLRAQPIEDIAHLDERRASVGLQPFAEYEVQMNQHETDRTYPNSSP